MMFPYSIEILFRFGYLRNSICFFLNKINVSYITLIEKLFYLSVIRDIQMVSYHLRTFLSRQTIEKYALFS